MKIGYPCINRTIGCNGNRTFRLKSYSEPRLIDTVTHNLDCLSAMLAFNIDHQLLFFRITSDLVPFASHPICQFDWLTHFNDQFTTIGNVITSSATRISMHPGQYTVLNSPDDTILARSIKELHYHADVLDALRLDTSAKMQIHIGGVYGDKDASIRRFIERYHTIDDTLKQRIVIENDDHSYTVNDCMRIYEETGVPILFDTFHDELNHSGLSNQDTLSCISRTWQDHDGIPMIDYSDYHSNGRRKSHAESIDISRFESFLTATRPYDFDIMLEIKDKETSALKAVEIARKDKRFFNG